MLLSSDRFTSCKLYLAMQRISSNFGQIAIGGDFRLRDQTGMEVTLADFKGKWVLVYFGFCRCPDICPEQLERLVEVQERLGDYFFAFVGVGVVKLC